MPPKRRAPAKSAKAPPKVELDEDAKEQLKNELDWVTTQLQFNIQKAKNQDQVEKLLKVINTLSKFVSKLHLLYLTHSTLKNFSPLAVFNNVSVYSEKHYIPVFRYDSLK